MIAGRVAVRGSLEPIEAIERVSTANLEIGVPYGLEGRVQFRETDRLDERDGGFEIVDGRDRPFDDLFVARAGKSAQRCFHLPHVGRVFGGHETRSVRYRI